ncbi:MAG: GntR family transcriptional regulator [Agriterribacter sp.]
MKRAYLLDLISVDEYSATPKYLQIVNSVVRFIKKGDIGAGDFIPSINELSIELDIARDTVERGYRHLKNIGIIDAVPRRGYYIKNSEFRTPLQIFLLFNKLSTHKKAIYDSFVESLGEDAIIDFYIYNNDVNSFRKILSGKKEGYSHYVIIPHYVDGADNPIEILNSIPKSKLILLDKIVPGLYGEYAAAYENFEDDIYNVLIQAIDQLLKYHTIKIIFPQGSYYPSDILRGFKKFCIDYSFEYKVINNLSSETINEGEVFIHVMEDDLIPLVEKIMQTNLKIGEQIGIISYNEIPLKKLILNGITTISTDFKEMGRIAAELILTNSKERIEVPFKLTLRDSL